jgi:hypothetical protein
MPDQHQTGSADTHHDQHVVEKLGYEARDILGRRRSIFYYAALHLGGLVVMGAIVVAIYLLISSRSPQFDTVGATGSPVRSEAAKIQSKPGPDMKTFKSETEAKLNSYGWVDESKGIVHVPIERAIELTVEDNLPHRSGSGQ